MPLAVAIASSENVSAVASGARSCARRRATQQRHARRESDEGERDERDDEEDSILIGHGTPAPTRDTARILIHAFHGMSRRLPLVPRIGRDGSP